MKVKVTIELERPLRVLTMLVALSEETPKDIRNVMASAGVIKPGEDSVQLEWDTSLHAAVLRLEWKPYTETQMELERLY